MAAPDDEELVLPEADFKYSAGSNERPWSHFTGRWAAIKPLLAQALRECGSERPLRVVDLGSCTGFFSLQAAHCHPEADVVAVEGSVGVGNGTVGTMGTTKMILGTQAVQTHLRWIQRLQLPNCFVAPEVWDFDHITALGAEGRPICDAMFLLSVVHHVDGVSTQQYAAAGLSRLEGFIAMMGRLLRLSPRHFVELPNRPWISCAYDAYGSQRAILEAAAKASGRQWRFKGPIYSVDWFGPRELWVMEADSPMASVDIHSCPFPLLFRDDQPSAAQGPELGPEDPLLEDLGVMGPYDDVGDAFDDGQDVDAGAPVLAKGGLQEFLLPLACPHLGGSLVDPGLMTLAEPGRSAVADGRTGEALIQAPTDLLLSHLALREAVSEACALLSEVKSQALQEELRAQQAAAPGNEAVTMQRAMPGARGPAAAGPGRAVMA